MIWFVTTAIVTHVSNVTKKIFHAALDAGWIPHVGAFSYPQFCGVNGKKKFEVNKTKASRSASKKKKKKDGEIVWKGKKID